MGNIKKIVIVGGMFTPVFARAIVFDTFVLNIIASVGRIMVVLLGVAVLLFIWGVVQFIASAGNEEARNTGRNHMIWGIVGFAVLLGLWGLVNVVLTAFGVSPGESSPTLPGIPG